MSNDMLSMLKKVSFYNILIGILLTGAIYLTLSKFAAPLFVGLVIGIINFIISSLITNLLLTKFHGSHLFMYIISFILRITLISLIGFMVYTQNKYYVFAYMGGYMIHLLGISIYSLSIKNES